MSISKTREALGVEVIVKADGTGRVTVEDGAVVVLDADDEHAAMQEAVSFIQSKAKEVDAPLNVRTTDSRGHGGFTIYPDARLIPLPGPDGPDGPDVSPQPQPQTRRELRTAGDFASTRPAARTAPADDGIRGFVNVVSGGVLKFAPSKNEAVHRGHRTSTQRNLDGNKTVAILNEKGGGTKTTVTALLSATLGRVRGGNILAWDNNENKGTLGDRLRQADNHERTAIDLLEDINLFESPDTAQKLVNYMRLQGEDKFHVLASQNRGSTRQVIDGAAFRNLHRALRTFYSLIIVDTGNASNASTWLAAVDEADSLVIAAMNKEDSAVKAASTIDEVVKRGHTAKLARGVAVITQPQNASRERLDRMREHLGQYVSQVVVVPFDAALDDGEQIVYERLKPATQEAYRAATGAIIDGL